MKLYVISIVVMQHLSGVMIQRCNVFFFNSMMYGVTLNSKFLIAKQ